MSSSIGVLHSMQEPLMLSLQAGLRAASPLYAQHAITPACRQFVLDMLQQLAAQQQALSRAGALPGTECSSDNAQLQPQQCVRQFLQHQQFAQQQPALLSSHQPSVAAPVDTWHKRESVKAPAPELETAPANTATMTPDYTSLTPTPSPSSTVTDYLAASAQQPAAPRLDGAFLAECFHSPRLAAGAKNPAWQDNSNQSFPCPSLANNLASQNMLCQSLPGQNSPNASLASTAHCYTSSSPSLAPCSSSMSVMKPEPLLHSQVASAAAPLADVLGKPYLHNALHWTGTKRCERSHQSWVCH